MSEKTGPEIKVESDEPLTRILSGINQIEEKHGERLDAITGDLTTFREEWDTAKRRIEELENKATNPSRGGLQNEILGMTDRERMDVCQNWMTACYNTTYGFQKDEDRSLLEEMGNIRVANQSSTNSEGGFFVPDPLSPMIFELVERHGVARKIFEIMPMTALTLKLNRETAGPTILIEGEGDAIAQTGATFGQSTLTAVKLAALDELTLELEQDAIRPLVPWLVGRFGRAIASKEDDLCFTLTTPFSGIFADTNAAATPAETEMGLVTVSGTDGGGSELTDLKYVDLVNTMHKVDDNVVDNGSWLFHHNVLAQCRKLLDANGNPIWSPMAGDQPATILGRPYTIANRAPASASGASKPILMYGDYKQGIFGNRMNLEVAFSNEAGFKNATRFMRVLERIAFVVVKKQALARLETVA